MSQPPSAPAGERVDPALFAGAMTYAAYRDLIKRRVAEGGHTGTKPSATLSAFTQLNDHRMDRVEKTVVLEDGERKRLRALARPVDWLVLTEGWCGDAAATVPVIELVADASSVIRARFLLRDEHPELMDRFLTAGGRSIPKLVALDPETGAVRGTWGPRPAPAQALRRDLAGGTAPAPYEEVARQLQLWYAQDRGRTTVAELLALAGA
jgi:hypothetical protein